MNILLFVSSMLMVLAGMTYARLETYRNLSLFQSQLDLYMTTTERGKINQIAVDKFENTHMPSQGEKKPKLPQPPENNNKPTNPQQTVKAKALSRLTFKPFVDQKSRNQHSTEFPHLYALAKKLIYTLYKEQPFFKQIERERPGFVDALLNSLMIADQLPQGQKMKRASDLARLDLGDPQLNWVFYEMLQETASQERIKKVPKNQKVEMPKLEFGRPEPIGGDEQEEGEKGKEKEEDYHSPVGFYSLLDFITLADGSKVRVYLAPRLLLLTIFDDPNVVEMIMQERQELYRQVSGHRVSANDASDLFKSRFASRADPLFQDILDYSVTQTKPTK